MAKRGGKKTAHQAKFGKAAKACKGLGSKAKFVACVRKELKK
jgi:hypothetical protein